MITRLCRAPTGNPLPAPCLAEDESLCPKLKEPVSVDRNPRQLFGEAVSTQHCVLFLIPNLGPGGAQRVITTLLRHLSRRRFRIILAVVDLRTSVFRDDLPADVEVIDLKASRVRYALWRIVPLIWRRRPDIVFSTFGHLNLTMALCRPLLPRKVTLIGRETHVASLNIANHFVRTMARICVAVLYRRFDVMVCQSRHMQRELIDIFWFPKERTAVIHNPVDIARIRLLAAEASPPFPVPRGAINLLAAGRLVEVKGFDLLIRAIAQLGTPNVHLTILGDGPLHFTLQDLAEELGVAGQVHLAGFQPNPYVWFVGAHAVVISSRCEAFPNVVLEALACGTPVIATPAAGGLREILEVVSECVIADSISAASLAEAIQTWMDRGRTQVPDAPAEKYSLASIIPQYESLFSRFGSS